MSLISNQANTKGSIVEKLFDMLTDQVKKVTA